MNNAIFYLHRVEEEIMKYFHCIRFYHTRYGLKNVGASFLLGGEKSTDSKEEVLLENLYLGPDYLKDEYTLLGCPISESPHYEFIKTIQEGSNINDTDYIRRYLKGCLDWRRGNIMPRNKDYFKNKFAHSLEQIKNNDYTPVVVYRQNGKYYVYDGKHRAAFCSLLGVPVRCVEVGNDFVNTGLWHYMFSLIERDTNYKKHYRFHEEYIKGNGR